MREKGENDKGGGKEQGRIKEGDKKREKTKEIGRSRKE